MSSRVPAWRRYLRFGGPNVRADVDDEIAFHVETTAAEYIASGDPPALARRRALEEFGNIGNTRRQCYAIGDRLRRRRERSEVFTALGQDVRYAVRVLRESPGFTIGVTTMIAVAMAVNAAAFALIDRMMIRSPAYLRSPSEIRRVYESGRVPDSFALMSRMSYRRYADVAQSAHAFSTIAAVYERDAVVRVQRSADIGRVAYVTGNFWDLFDAAPAIGRFTRPDDDASATGSNVAVLSDHLWRLRFHADPDAIGGTIVIGDVPYRIVGIAPPKFTGVWLASPSVFVPISATSNPGSMLGSFIESYTSSWLEVIARRRPDWTDERATADLTGALRASLAKQRALNAEAPSTIPTEEGHGELGPIQSERGPLPSSESRVAEWLAGLAAVVLLIAALNAASLMLTRMIRRQREIAVRLALGISAVRLTRLLFVEALMVVACGAIASLGIVWWAGDVVRQRILANTRLPAIDVDARVVAFTGVSALVAAALIALAPSIRALRWNVATAIGDGGAAGGLRRSRVRAALMAFQTAFSLALVVAAGLFIRSVRTIHALPLGYDPIHVLIVGTPSRSMNFPGLPDAIADSILAHVAAIGDVVSSAQSVSLPFSKQVFRRFAAPAAGANAYRGRFLYNAISPDYFRTMGTRVIAGRGFSASDDANATPVAIVTRPMAERLWPGRNAVGQCLAFDADGKECARVVGVAEPTRQWSYEHDEMLAYYVPMAQTRNRMESIVLLRTTRDARTVAERVRRVLEADVPDGVRLQVTPMQDALDLAAQSWRIGATMLSIFATLALVLAGVGIYGAVAYDLSERQRDLGIRVALGASTGHLAASGVVRVAGVAMLGVGLGLMLALVVGWALGPLLFGVSGRDPATFASAAVVMLTALVAASTLPALRAARADPSAILRSG